MDFIKKFLQTETAGGAILAICTLVALAIANSGLSENYFYLLHFSLAGLTVHHWINDGLMTIFFFVVGMEIKRELAIGELSTVRKASLPFLAAIGGMLFPALIYRFFNHEGALANGWGIPMATDIAFAVGLLSVFGSRVPLALKIFLLALAIVDDLGAVLVIAFFYTQEISVAFLAASVGVFLLTALVRYLKWSAYVVYVALGIATWFFLLRSGVHATIAGVALGLLTPLRLTGKENSPLEELVHVLHPYVTFLIMPIFALANAGVDLRDANLAEIGQHPIAAGIALGLFFGKPIGVVLLSWLGVVSGIAELPRGVGWTKIIAVGFAAGIGFTMALFIGGLALPPLYETYTKVGILAGSLLSALVGVAVLGLALRNKS